MAEDFGATATVGADWDEAATVERVRELTHGGTEHVMKCVEALAMQTAVDICRLGGTVDCVGVPHGVDEEGPELYDFFGDNVALEGSVALVQAYANELLADVVGRRLDPLHIFTKTVSLENTAEGYRTMDEREAIKILVRPEQ